MAEHGADAGGGILVPVGRSVALRNTVSYAVEQALASGADEPVLHFVAPVPWDEIEGVNEAERAATEALLERVRVWAREDSGGAVTVETAVIGADQYLFSPDDFAHVLATYAEERGLDRVVVDPEYSPGGNVPLLRPMEVALVRRGLSVEEAPVERTARRTGLPSSWGYLRFGVLFVVSFVFYQLLGGFAIVTGDTYDLYYELVTGTIAAGIVAGSLHQITISVRPNLRRYAGITARFVLFVPYVVYEIVVANLYITTIILHPRLPIEPRLTRVRAAVWGPTQIMTLGNVITLTPGTLTVRSEGQELYVHTLFPEARDGLFGGSLERATRFLFSGRDSMAIATPEERGDTELLQRGDDE